MKNVGQLEDFMVDCKIKTLMTKIDLYFHFL